MSTAVGLGVIGKNEKIKATTRNTSARSLTRPPHLPRLQRRGSNGSPRRRLSLTHPIEMMYENMSAALEMETIALRVTSDPKLIQARTSDDPRQTNRAFTGMSQPGLTCSIQDENGRPLSRAKAQICRDDAAVTETAAKRMRMTRMAPMMIVPAMEPVAL